MKIRAKTIIKVKYPLGTVVSDLAGKWGKLGKFPITENKAEFVKQILSRYALIAKTWREMIFIKNR